ncbi:DUF3465 domain-containing protein [Marinomonas spartinae]|uniref:DUF3465 domain-containing protein n=1 Tax=Marinomonas spartinae TaxID=1792290 RepID=UPI0018F1FF24|nr:DUF3465 domain-containing protein [Marinomonas spartinae]
MKFIFILLVCFVSWLPTLSLADDSRLQQAFELHQSDLQVEGTGRVVRILKDDTKGIKHQRFILKLPSGQTLLVAHNIDLAPKIMDLKKGDTVEFYGEYEWNRKGGVLHWTHRDPHHRHVDGWLKHNGRTYQ